MSQGQPLARLQATGDQQAVSLARANLITAWAQLAQLLRGLWPQQRRAADAAIAQTMVQQAAALSTTRTGQAGQLATARSQAATGLLQAQQQARGAIVQAQNALVGARLTLRDGQQSQAADAHAGRAALGQARLQLQAA